MSAVSTVGGDQDGSYKSDGTINTGYIHNCIFLSNVNKKEVIHEKKEAGSKIRRW